MIVNRAASCVVHRQFVRAAQPGHVTGLGKLNSRWLPRDHEARAREQTFPGIPNRFLRHCARCVRRQDNCVIRIIRDGLLEIFSCRGFRPLPIEITKNSLH